MNTKQIILVVEDDMDDAFLLEWAIHQAGSNKKIHRAQTGEEALSYLEGEGYFSDREAYPLPSMVFIDLKMPRVNGFDILRWKMERPHLKMPFIVLSGTSDEKDFFRANQLGASMFLTKPVSRETLNKCFKQFGLDF